MTHSIRSLILGAALAVGPFTAFAQSDPTETSWQRVPELTVPILEKAPTIDGNVTEEEWRGAAALSPILSMLSGVSDEFGREVFIGYGPENIYIAFRLQRPEEALEPGAKDFVEIMFNPSLDFKTGYNFWVQGDGNVRFGLLRPHTQWVQAPEEWQSAVGPTPYGWQGEVAIPYTLLGLDGPPSNGTVWGFDFVDNRRTPFRMVSLWSYRGYRWQKLQNFGRLHFEGPVPAARFEEAGPASADTVEAGFSVSNTTGNPALITGRIELLRRKEGAEGGADSYYVEIEAASDDDYESGGRDFYIGASIEQLASEALGHYETLDVLDLSAESIEVPAGQSRQFGLLEESREGEYLVIYDLVDQTSGLRLMRGVAPFEVSAPLEVTAYPFWLNAQIIDVRADLRKVTVNEPTVCRFEIEDESGEVFSSAETKVTPKGLEARAILETAELPEGFYRVTATLRRENGEEIVTNFATVEKPPVPEWHDNTHGNRIVVSTPWTPVVADKDGLVEVWGRQYDLSTLLPRSIISQGDEILASPVKLRLLQNGRELPLTVSEFRLEEKTEGYAIYSAVLDNEELTLSGTVRIEFDGLAWYDLRLKPKDGPVSLDRAILEMAVSGKHAKLMDHHRLLHDPALSQQAPGPVFTQGNSLKGPIPAATFPFSPYIWIGDEQAGLGFVAEAPIDWQVGDPAAMMRVTPPESAQDAAVLEANIIDKPFTLDKPMRLLFGLQATPIRELPSVEKLHIAQGSGILSDEESYAQLAEAGGAVWVAHGGWRGEKRAPTWGGWPAPIPDPERHQNAIDGVQAAHKHGIKVPVYTGWGIDSTTDEWRYFGNEMAAFPITNRGFGTYSQSAGLDGSYADFMAWSHARLVDIYDIDGVFYDSVTNLNPDSNLHIGNAWVDDEGRIRPKYPVLATRDLLRRIYNVYHGESQEDGVIVNFGGSLAPINVYADVFHRGEGQPMHAEYLRDAWVPLEDYRASYDARKYGIFYLAMNKNFKGLPMTVNNHHAVTLLHDLGFTKATLASIRPDEQGYGVKDMPHASIWQTRSWLPLDGDSKRFYFYEDQEVVRPEEPELLSSAFTSGDGERCVLVVSNLDPENVTTNVTLDYAGLGMKKGTYAIEDAITGEAVELNGNEFSIDIEPERFRLLRLYVE